MFIRKRSDNHHGLYDNEYGYRENEYGKVNYNNFEVGLNDHSLNQLHNDDANDFKGYDILEKFFFLMIGGVGIFVLLTIVLKCCNNKNADTYRRSTSPCTHRYCHSNNLNDCILITSENTPIVDRPEDDPVTRLDVQTDPDRLDLPPSYDVSTENSQHNSCNNLYDVHDGIVTSVEDVCDAPPSYSEAVSDGDVCGTD